MKTIEPENTPSATLRRMLFVLVAALVVVFGIAARADSIRVYDQVGVRQAQVTLADVAELEGEAAKALGATVLYTFDAERGEQVITLDRIEEALEKAGANRGLISLRGFSACRVARLSDPPAPMQESGRSVVANIETPIGLGTPLTLQAVVERRLIERAGAMGGEVEVSFSERDRKRMDIPVLGRTVEVEPISPNTLGRVSVVVRLYEGRSVSQTLTVQADVSRRELAVVAVRPISRGELIDREALQVREVSLKDDALRPIADPSIAIGQVCASNLRVGDVVTENAVRPPLMVRRGELVDIRCFIGGLVVRAVGIAKEDGAMGDRIQVRRENSSEVIEATVAGRREVVIASPSDRLAQGTPGTMRDAGRSEVMP